MYIFLLFFTSVANGNLGIGQKGALLSVTYRGIAGNTGSSGVIFGQGYLFAEGSDPISDLLP